MHKANIVSVTDRAKVKLNRTVTGTMQNVKTITLNSQYIDDVFYLLLTKRLIQNHKESNPVLHRAIKTCNSEMPIPVNLRVIYHDFRLPDC